MSSEDKRAAFIDKVVACAGKRWRGAIPDDDLDDQLADLRLLLFTHPVAMEYVTRAMSQTLPQHLEEHGAAAAKKVVGG